MFQAGFPKTLWEEAVRNAVYLTNRRFNCTRKGVPYDVFTGATSEILQLKFGEQVLVKKIKKYDAGDKFDPVILKGFYTGMASMDESRMSHGTSKAVRIFVEQDNTIIFRDYISKTGLIYKHICTTQAEITLGMNLPDIAGE